jgi:hypothetical protein
MQDVWLQNNRRVFLAGAVLPGCILAITAFVAVGLVPGVDSAWIRMIAACVALLATVMVIALIWQAGRPRIAYRDGHVLVYLRMAAPVWVPLEVVEAFLLGQGRTGLSGKQLQNAQVRTVVIRLAEKAESWHRREVKQSLGSWCDGYITIRGTWCEPLDISVIRRLNTRLSKARAATNPNNSASPDATEQLA